MIEKFLSENRALAPSTIAPKSDIDPISDAPRLVDRNHKIVPDWRQELSNNKGSKGNVDIFKASSHFSETRASSYDPNSAILGRRVWIDSR